MFLTDLTIRFDALEWANDVQGIRALEATLEERRCAIVEYEIGARRLEWCRDGHVGLVLSGAVEYEFADGGPPLSVRQGDAFQLATGRQHRGRNRAEVPARLFLIDDFFRVERTRPAPSVA